MLGFSDPWIALVYILTLGAGLLCVIYGVLNWNKGAENEKQQIQEEQDWQEQEEKLTKE